MDNEIFRLPEVRLVIYGIDDEPLDSRAMALFLNCIALNYDFAQMSLDGSDGQELVQLLDVQRSRLEPHRRLIIERLRQQSPWQVSLNTADVLSCLGGIWVMIQAIEKLSLIRLNRQKVRAEIVKIHAETRKILNDLSDTEGAGVSIAPHYRSSKAAVDELIESLASRHEHHPKVADWLQHNIERLRKLEIKVADVKIRLLSKNFRQNNS